MPKFSPNNCISHGREDVDEFVAGHLCNAENVLFIGTVGIETSSLHYPNELKGAANVRFAFFVEHRPNTGTTLQILGERHKKWLESNLPESRLTFADVQVMADDGATVAGRNAVSAAARWYDQNYSDIVVDCSGMSRGVCFPVLLQAVKFGEQIGANVHLLVASFDHRSVTIKSESNDRADWMHGFQGEMGLDRSSDALTLWIPQLSRDSLPQTNVMSAFLSQRSVAEVCPIIPFPSIDPRRGDELLYEFREAFQGDGWSERTNVIYAHESDPMDVFRSIVRMEDVRREVFAATGKQAVTVLSPSGWRLGSLGMVLAAIALELPLLYVETIGYTTDSPPPPEREISQPQRRWHIWIAGAPYATMSN